MLRNAVLLLLVCLSTHGLGWLIPWEASDVVASLFLNHHSLPKKDPFQGVSYHSGYIHVDRQGGEMFYWYFPNAKGKASNTIPFMVWLTGGPGCSSELAALTENGPLTVKDDGTIVKNPYSWTNVGDIVYVDQPLGTGFSKAGDPRNYVTNEKALAEDMREFLEEFIELYPSLKHRPFYVIGESYAGHYIPSLAELLVKDPIDGLQLKGIAIGNGWVDPKSQYPSYALYAYEHGLITNMKYQLALRGFDACVKLIDRKLWPLAIVTCNAISSDLIRGKNPYDIRLDCETGGTDCYNMTSLTAFLNSEDVQKDLHVSTPWKECSPLVYALMLGDWAHEMRSIVGSLLDNNIDVLIYHGDQDYICNWRGGNAWVDNIQWRNAEQFQKTKFVSWDIDDLEAGEIRQVDNLKFVRIYDAGHMVPMDQPAVALEMMKQFVGGATGADVEGERQNSDVDESEEGQEFHWSDFAAHVIVS